MSLFPLKKSAKKRRVRTKINRAETNWGFSLGRAFKAHFMPERRLVWNNQQSANQVEENWNISYYQRGGMHQNPNVPYGASIKNCSACFILLPTGSRCISCQRRLLCWADWFIELATGFAVALGKVLNSWAFKGMLGVSWQQKWPMNN